MRLLLSIGALFILSIVEAPNNCKLHNESYISTRNNWTYANTCEIHNLPKLSLSEKYSKNLRNSKKSNWEHDVYWIYANTWTDLLMPSISNNLKETGFDPLDVLNISDVIWGNVLFINCTANLYITDGKMSYISKLERQGDALMSFASNNLLQINVTVRNPYLFCRFDYSFEATIFPYVWQSGELFADVKNVTSNLLLTLDTSKQVIGLEKLTILDIGSIHVTLDNDIPILDQFFSKVVNYMLPFYKQKIIQISEETVSDVIYVHLTQMNKLLFGR